MPKPRSITVFAIATIWAHAANAAPPPQKRIAYEVAKTTALKSHVGKVLTSSLEERSDRWFYGFEIQDKNGTKEVLVDAISGRLMTEEVPRYAK